MERNILYEIDSLYRDNFRVTGFQFGEGEKSICIVGSMRGNEYQQIYTCSQLVKKLKRLEEKGRIEPGKSILVIPCANPYSVNTKKRFWTIDNTDINRMFPGYDLGETTQRIAGGIFEQIKDYRFGVQFASFYMPGNFVPQVRMMKTGLENIELAGHFGLPYVVLHDPRPFDTATLNYNWQIWETDAFSIYTTSTGAGEILALVTDPYTGEVKQTIHAPINGTVAFVHNETLAYQNTAVIKLISEEDVL